MRVRRFKVNDYITLKLEDNKTVIYVGGKKFNQCKHLFIINPQEREDQWEINSIDDAVDALRETLNEDIEPIGIDPEDVGLTPQEEFWGHCSNLQVWAEHNYDSRLIHSNLAFPLLRELATKGDKSAKKYFKDEIFKAMKRENFQTTVFLINKKYFDYLSKEESESVLNYLSDNYVDWFFQNFEKYKPTELKDFVLSNVMSNAILTNFFLENTKDKNLMDLLKWIGLKSKLDLLVLKVSDPDSPFFDNIIDGFKSLLIERGWFDVFKLPAIPALLKNHQAKLFKRKVMNLLRNDEILQFDIVIKLRWIELFSIEELIRDSSINFIDKLIQITTERFNNNKYSSYDLEWYIPILHELIQDNENWDKYWNGIKEKKEKFEKFIYFAYHRAEKKEKDYIKLIKDKLGILEYLKF